MHRKHMCNYLSSLSNCLNMEHINPRIRKILQGIQCIPRNISSSCNQQSKQDTLEVTKNIHQCNLCKLFHLSRQHILEGKADKALDCLSWKISRNLGYSSDKCFKLTNHTGSNYLHHPCTWLRPIREARLQRNSPLLFSFFIYYRLCWFL